VSTVCQLTSIAHEDPLFISMPSSETNTAKDFLEFVYSMVEQGALNDGDVFIVDNASVHFAAETAEELSELVGAAGVRLVFTPVYSPELNPCEFVFAQVKRFLREHSHENKSFLAAIVEAFASVSHQNVENYYRSCVSIRAV